METIFAMNGVFADEMTIPGAIPAALDIVTVVDPATVVIVLWAISVSDQSAYRYAHLYAPRIAGRMTGMSRAFCESAVTMGPVVKPEPPFSTLTCVIAPPEMTASISSPYPAPEKVSEGVP
jgi:hypothetical protein